MSQNYLNLYGCEHKVINHDGCDNCGKSLKEVLADDADYVLRTDLIPTFLTSKTN